jgi:hypothetical protein
VRRDCQIPRETIIWQIAYAGNDWESNWRDGQVEDSRYLHESLGLGDLSLLLGSSLNPGGAKSSLLAHESGNPCITSSALSRRLGETPVVCGPAEGFVLVRILFRLPTKGCLLESYGGWTLQDLARYPPDFLWLGTRLHYLPV